MYALDACVYRQERAVRVPIFLRKSVLSSVKGNKGWRGEESPDVGDVLSCPQSCSAALAN